MWQEACAMIKRLLRQGKVFIIQPETPLNLGRIEKNKEKLTNVYNIGYEQAKKQYDALM